MREIGHDELPAEIVDGVWDDGMALAVPSTMEYAAAATMEETRGRAEPRSAGTFSAYLRLRQGASARATWVLEESVGGSMISVGADEACDWQLRAAFVPARAFSLLVVGGRTFVRSGPEPGVLLNGKAIDDGWIQVPNGGRIDVGLARLEVTMGYGDTSAELMETLEQVQRAEESSRSTVHQAERTRAQRDVGRTTMNLGVMPIEPAVTEPRAVQARAAAERARARSGNRNATIELQLEDLYIEPDRPSARVRGALDDVPQARLLGHESGEFEKGSMPLEPELGAPALLEAEAPTDKRRWWLYALAGVATAGAYGGWVFLLDAF
jgi:hypothetical protein